MTSFHKQQYVAIASILSKAETKDYILERLVTLFAADNPRFNKYIFLEACGIPQKVNCSECKAEILWKDAYYQRSTPEIFLCMPCNYGTTGADEL